MDLSDIKVVMSEIDGIVTEHLVGLGEFNAVLFKQFYMKDFEAINLMKKDWIFVFMSSDANVNASMCRKRNIPFYFAERSKKDTYANIISKYGITPDNVLYVGSSYSDIDCIRLSGVSMCPEDAVTQVQNTVDYVIPVYSGTGVLCHVYETLAAHKLDFDRTF